MIGKRFERLTVLEQDLSKTRGNGKSRVWVCKCDCGNTVYVTTGDLNSGNTKSCGCYRRDNSRKNNTTHGRSRSTLYNVWNTMKARCYNKNNGKYPSYGGRGITVCQEWLHDFTVFYDWAISNGYKRGLSIDRIDVNGDYEPTNCRWADRIVQANNTRTNRMIEFNGEKHTVAEWSRITGITASALYHRLWRGWSVEDALTRPQITLPKE